MDKRAVNLKIILAILIFLIIIIFIFYKLFPLFESGGRFGCKMAYSLISPLGIVTSLSAVVETAHKWLPYIIIAADVISEVVSAYMRARSEVKNLQKAYEYECIDKPPPSVRNAFFNNLKNSYTSNKIYLYSALFRQGLRISSINIDLTETVARLQRGLFKTLCPTVLEKNVISSDGLLLDECKRDLYSEIISDDKKAILASYWSYNSNLTCLMYLISKYVRKTYLESLKLSVRMGEGLTHYAVFVNYTLNQKVYLSDLLVFLDLLEYKKEDKVFSLYEDIYGSSNQICDPVGTFYSNYRNFKELCDLENGTNRIIAFYVNTQTPDVSQSGVIFDSPGIYRLNIGYDGQGSLLIISIKFKA